MSPIPIPARHFLRWLPALVPLLCVACGRTGGTLRSAVLVTLDTTRRDALGTYGSPMAARTPELDALAARGIVFEDAHTVAPLTLPAHASMLTGLWPPRHGLRNNGFGSLPAGTRTVAEQARDAGFQTAAFVAAVVLKPTFGLGRGFDTYSAPTAASSHSTQVVSRPGPEVVAAAIDWLASRDQERPFFLWVHLFEPHAPYEPPPELAEQSRGDPYLGEVSAMDACVGTLLDALAATGEPVSTMVVADHGEGRGEHEEETHGYFLYEGTLAVPMLLVRADGERAGERSPAPASVVDVAPTLIQAMGLAPMADLDGLSLWNAPALTGRGVYAESYAGHLAFGWSPITAWIADGRKYVQSSRPELYDLAADPGERSDLSAKDALIPQRAEIGRVAARALQPQDVIALSDPALVDEIQALGYATVDLGGRELPDPLAPTDAPSPHDCTLELRLTLYAADQFNQGEPAVALPLFDSILERNPRNLRALGMRVNCLIALDRRADAIEPLQEYLRRTPGTAGEHHELGVCLYEAGRVPEAIASFRRALELSTTTRAWFPGFLDLLESQGLHEEAAHWRERFSGDGDTSREASGPP